jgi:hypothetical protein
MPLFEFPPAYAPELNPGRISVVTLEAARAAELLPEEFRGIEPLCAEGTAADAPPAYSGNGILGAGRAVSFVTMVCSAE